MFENLEDKIDFTKNILLVDVNYLTYARFFASRRWYINYNDNDDKNTDIEQDWIKNDEFMESFKRLYFKKVNINADNYDIPSNNIIYAMDCNFNDNWRYKIDNEYKLTRKEAHKNNNFSNWNIFNYVENELLKDKMLYKINNLEADDIISLLIKKIKLWDDKINDNNRLINYYILANDKDYIQICNDRTNLIDINSNNISVPILKECSNIDYLIKKILLGDKSDNINACYINSNLINLAGIKTKKKELKCTKKTVDILLKNKLSRNIIYELLNYYRNDKDNYNEFENKYFINNKFTKNTLLIDFKMISNKYIQNE